VRAIIVFKEYEGRVLVFGLLSRMFDIWPEDLREVLLIVILPASLGSR
jgi:hypothetical protein